MRALRELDRRLNELHAADRAAEEAACFELARSASRFTRRTQQVVDDTVSLSATLMRAGEVTEANRMLEEAEIQVRNEEAALIETVNEVKAAGEIRKRRMTKLRLAKAFATTLLSGSMFAFSAFGVALARFALQPEASGSSNAAPLTRDAIEDDQAREVEVAPGVKIRLTLTEVKKLSRLANAGDPRALEAFLKGRLPASLVARVQEALMPTVTTVAELLQQVPAAAELQAIQKEAAEQSSEPSPEPADSPSPEDSPPPEESPAEEEPGPSPGSSQEPDEDSPLEGLPIPIDDGD
jgi:hypothetical protein